jgi:hypothetical protein
MKIALAVILFGWLAILAAAAISGGWSDFLPAAVVVCGYAACGDLLWAVVTKARWNAELSDKGANMDGEAANMDGEARFCPDCWEEVEDGIAILTHAEKIEAYLELRACCPDGRARLMA